MLFACSCRDEDGLVALTRVLVVNPDAVDFGEAYVGGLRTGTLTLSNEGTAPIRLDPPRIDDDDTFAARDVPNGLAVGAQSTFTVEFRPTRVDDNYAATLVIENDAGAPVVIALRGSARAAPDCDDDNECTNETFDPIAELCVRTNRNGACDDESACTDNDRCSDGACVGAAIDCAADGVACTVDACDPAIGCVHTPDHDACADDDPCTLDTCDASSLFGDGCTHGPAPDGTLCGELVQCATVDLCVSQLCVSVDISNGTPCVDGDACTEDDTCNDGTCVGTPVVTGEASLGSETFRYVTPRATNAYLLAKSHAAIVDDVIVLADRTVHVVSAATLAPVAHINEVVFPVQSVLARPSGGRVAVHQGADSLSGAPPRVLIVDVTDVDEPSLHAVAGLQEVGVELIGANAEQLLVCHGGLLAAFDWDGQLIEANEAEILCAGGSRVKAGDAAVRRRDDDFRAIDIFSLVDPSSPVATVALGTRDDHLDQESIDGALVAVSRFDEIHIVDVTDPSAPEVTQVPLAGSPEVKSILLRRPWLYFSTNEAVRRLDVSTPSLATVDETWRVAGKLYVAAAGENVVVLTSVAPPSVFSASPSPTHGWRVASAHTGAGGVLATPLSLGHGGIDIVAASATTILGAGPDGIVSFTDATTQDAFPLLVELREDAKFVLFEAGDARGFYAQPATSDSLGTGAGPLSLVRRDRRAPIDLTEDLVFRVRLEETPSLDTLESHELFAFPTHALGVDTMHSIAFEGCAGVAVASCVTEQELTPNPISSAPVSPEPEAPCPGPRLVAYESCTSDGSLTVAHAVLPTLTNPDDIVSASIDGTHASFLATTSAALFDTSNGAVIEAALPEMEDAKSAFASYDDGLWLIVLTYGDAARAARAFVFDIDAVDGTATRRTSFDVGAPALDEEPVIDIARRALGIIDGLAYVSDWDPAQTVNSGHSIVIYDLATDPPALLDTVAIASEPTALVAREAGLVVGRVDGVSVIAPVCAP